MASDLSRRDRGRDRAPDWKPLLLLPGIFLPVSLWGRPHLHFQNKQMPFKYMSWWSQALCGPELFTSQRAMLEKKTNGKHARHMHTHFLCAEHCAGNKGPLWDVGSQGESLLRIWAKVAFLSFFSQGEGNNFKCHLGEKWHPLLFLFLINADNRLLLWENITKQLKICTFLIRKIIANIFLFGYMG